MSLDKDAIRRMLEAKKATANPTPEPTPAPTAPPVEPPVAILTPVGDSIPPQTSELTTEPTPASDSESTPEIIFSPEDNPLHNNEGPEASASEAPTTPESFEEKSFIVAGKSLQGRHYTKNMDTFLIDKDHEAIAVFDGVGSYNDGASQFALQEMSGFVAQLPQKTEPYELKNIIIEEMKAISDQITLTMGAGPRTPATTAVFAKTFIDKSLGEERRKLCVANVGDSRVYVIRGGKIIYETLDQMGSENPNYNTVLNNFTKRVEQNLGITYFEARDKILATCKKIDDILDDSNNKDEHDDLARELLAKLGLNYDTDWLNPANISLGFQIIFETNSSTNQMVEQSLGSQLPLISPRVDFVDIQTGDLVLAFSDGVNGNFTDKQLLELIEGVRPEEIPDKVLNAIKACWENNPTEGRYKYDDATIAVMEIGTQKEVDSSAPAQQPTTPELKNEITFTNKELLDFLKGRKDTVLTPADLSQYFGITPELASEIIENDLRQGEYPVVRDDNIVDGLTLGEIQRSLIRENDLNELYSHHPHTAPKRAGASIFTQPTPDVDLDLNLDDPSSDPSATSSAFPANFGQQKYPIIPPDPQQNGQAPNANAGPQPQGPQAQNPQPGAAQQQGPAAGPQGAPAQQQNPSANAFTQRMQDLLARFGSDKKQALAAALSMGALVGGLIGAGLMSKKESEPVEPPKASAPNPNDKKSEAQPGAGSQAPNATKFDWKESSSFKKLTPETQKTLSSLLETKEGKEWIFSYLNSARNVQNSAPVSLSDSEKNAFFALLRNSKDLLKVAYENGSTYVEYGGKTYDIGLEIQKLLRDTLQMLREVAPGEEKEILGKLIKDTTFSEFPTALQAEILQKLTASTK